MAVPRVAEELFGSAGIDESDPDFPEVRRIMAREACSEEEARHILAERRVRQAARAAELERVTGEAAHDALVASDLEDLGWVAGRASGLVGGALGGAGGGAIGGPGGIWPGRIIGGLAGGEAGRRAQERLGEMAEARERRAEARLRAAGLQPSDDPRQHMRMTEAGPHHEEDALRQERQEYRERYGEPFPRPPIVFPEIEQHGAMAAAWQWRKQGYTLSAIESQLKHHTGRGKPSQQQIAEIMFSLESGRRTPLHMPQRQGWALPEGHQSWGKGFRLIRDENARQAARNARARGMSDGWIANMLWLSEAWYPYFGDGLGLRQTPGWAR